MSEQNETPLAARINSHMASVHRHRNEINQLQAAWDNLSLLGQLSGTGTDMTETRRAFSELTDSVLKELSHETLNKVVAELTAKAQVIVDIVIRNLFERTADIGFLATDDDIRQFLFENNQGELSAPDVARIRARFKEYVKKYSVYSNIILLDPHGQVLVQLDDENHVERSNDPLISQAKTTSMPYVEVFRKTDLLPNQGESLIYAYKVTTRDGSRVLGVLCLCFRFQNEMKGVFGNLIEKDSWIVGLMLDQERRVIASSDEHHIPLHAQLEIMDEGGDWLLTRFAGREYICVTRMTQGYQGYMGPNWMGHAMIPLQHAFSQEVEGASASINEQLLSKVMRSPMLFSQGLLEIPKRAALIQNKLNQSVWNGSIWQSRSSENKNNNFSKLLLGEMSNTGLKTQGIVEKSVSELYQTVVSMMLENSSFHAFLAVDIMDRNLYERANDCRWWALATSFRKILAQPQISSSEAAELSNILEYINSLYTVYENLVIFDRHGKVIAVSNSKYSDTIGSIIEEDWVRAAKACKNTQEYAVSHFQPSVFSGNKPTYIYSACVRSEDGFTAVGGIGAVFDSQTQFESMLNDALPRDVDAKPLKGSFTLFVDGDMKIISSTAQALKVGSEFTIHPDICQLSPGETGFDIAVYDGLYYAVGACASSGYREFKGEGDSYRNQIVGLIFIPLGAIKDINDLIEIDEALQQNQFKPSNAMGGQDSIEYATFYVGAAWFGLPASQILEAAEAINIRPIPDGSPMLAGVYSYDDDVISVVYAAKLLGLSNSMLEYGQQIIIIAASGDRPRFGLLVSALGEIPAINVADIEPIGNIFSGNGLGLVEGVLHLPSGTNSGGMLTILSANGILAKVKF